MFYLKYTGLLNNKLWRDFVWLGDAIITVHSVLVNTFSDIYLQSVLKYRRQTMQHFMRIFEFWLAQESAKCV